MGITTVLRNCLFLGTETFRRGNLLCFRKISFWKNVREKKVGGHHDCPQVFLSHGMETFRREPFIVSEKFWFRNFSCIKGLGVSGFYVNLFCFTVRKALVKETFCVSENFWYRKTLRKRKGVGIRILVSFFASQYRHISLGNTSSFENKSSIEIFHA